MRDRKEEPNTEFMGGKSFIFIVYYLVAWRWSFILKPVAVFDW
jgi:hypothetical protein